MLGVFSRVADKADPIAPVLPGPEYIPGLKDGYLEKHFATVYSRPVIVHFGTYGFFAYSADKKISPGPRPIFGVKDGIYCIYKGHMESRKQEPNEVDLLIACYWDVKVKANKAPSEAMELLAGDNNYILYDSSVNREGATRGALAVNCLKNMSLYYGVDSEGSCIISDDINIMEKVCHENSFKLIPEGYGLLIPVSVEPKEESTDSSGSSSVGAPKEEQNQINSSCDSN